MQLLVTLPSGVTRCVVDVTCANDVLRVLGASDGVLLAAGRLLAGETALPAHVDHAQLLYCVRGGKGGFGAMLRGGPTGLRIKKTTNFDACRDSSGRRLRNARVGDELREWAAKQKERDQEKKVQLESKQAARQARKQEASAQFAEEAQKLQESTATALQKGLQKLKSKGVADAAAAARREQRQVRTFFAGDDAFGDLDDADADSGDGAADVTSTEDYTIYDAGHVTCDECGCAVIGVRWHALDKDDYDLCDACYAKLPAHDASTAYLRVIQSAAPAAAAVAAATTTTGAASDEPVQKRARPE